MKLRVTLAGWFRGLVDIEKTCLDRSLGEAARYAGGNLLDVGCGDKPYEALFAPYVQSHVGVEYRETYQESMNANLGKADFLYDGRTLPFADGSYQTVLATQILEHVPDPAAIFRELTRVLAPGGRLILTVPFSYRIHSVPYDFHRFTRFALERLAHDNGLEVERLAPRGGFWLVMGQKLTSHMALRWARLGRTVQETGGFGYEQAKSDRPRWWTLPLVAPAILLASLLVKVLERLDPDPTDTLGYLLVARKHPPMPN